MALQEQGHWWSFISGGGGGVPCLYSLFCSLILCPYFVSLFSKNVWDKQYTKIYNFVQQTQTIFQLDIGTILVELA